MTVRSLKAAMASALLLTIASSFAMPAAAGPMEFCDGSACKTAVVVNSSNTVVTRVVVTQLNKGGCAKVEKTHNANMIDTDPSTQFRLKINPACTYRVAFKTTKGCVGDKVREISPDDVKNGVEGVVLNKACGSLTVGWIRD